MHQKPEGNLKDTKQRLLAALRHAGIEESECLKEADLICEYATGWKLAEQILKADQLLSQQAQQTISFIAEQRSKRMPLQYCLGHTYFMGLKIIVRPGVLIPRPDTEKLVEVVLRRLEKITAPHICEIGTGSGAVAVALLVRRPDAEITGIDISADAMALTYENAMLHGVSDRLTLVKADWKDALPYKLDAVVANPPYIARSRWQELPPEIRRWEPYEALFGDDEDGLGFYRDFSQAGHGHLKSGGLAALEVPDGTAGAIAQILRQTGWQSVEAACDLNGLDRVVSAQSPGGN